VFVVDDNFIGNKKRLKSEILPAIIEWQRKRKHALGLITQASINLSDDEELMRLMVAAGFDTVFVGIETQNEDSLAECNKNQNRGRDLVASVKRIQNQGLQVQGGFIIGFDSDPASIFKSQIDFIQKSGIVTAMVGLLNAPRGTRLYQRLKKENRLLETVSGDNTDCSMNFIPKMDQEKLVSGYKQVLTTIYSPNQYYKRVKIFLNDYKPQRKERFSQFELSRIRAFVKSMWYLGIRDRWRRQHCGFLLSILLRRPRAFPMSVKFAVYGLHFRSVIGKYVAVPGRESTGLRKAKTAGLVP
jgi:radical SAM superfamily enzyme YgiQ (UPF0313 family)